MAIEMQQYIKKPLYVDAVRISADNFEEIAAWCDGEILWEPEDHPQKPGQKYIKVDAHHPKNARQTKAFTGDWILSTDRGYKIYTNKSFHESFDRLGETESLVMGSEEVAPGVSLNQLVLQLRAGEVEYNPPTPGSISARTEQGPGED